MDRRLPFELIAKIFAYCVHEYRVPPERLSRISSLLRHIVLNSAELWTFVYYGAVRDLPRMLVCLERSASAPLTVELDLTKTFSTNEVAMVALASILSPHFTRVRSFRLGLYDGWKTIEPLYSASSEGDRLFGLERFLDLLHDGKSSDALILEDFELRPGAGALEMSIPPFVQRSLLHTLKAEEVTLRSVSRTLRTSAQSLEVIHLNLNNVGTPTFSEVMDALDSLTELRELKLELPLAVRQAASNLSVAQTKPFRLNTVRSLTIIGHLSPILPLVQFPSLISLKLDFSGDDSSSYLENLLPFLVRHAGTLARLSLPNLPQNIAQHLEKRPLPFPALKLITGAFVQKHSSAILSTIQGVSLTEIDISVYQSIPLEALTDFFAAASSTIRRATVSYAHLPSRQGVQHELMPLEPLLDFPSLETFTSWCYFGDAVVALIQTAPHLKELQLNGPIDPGALSYLEHLASNVRTIHLITLLKRAKWLTTYCSSN